jgi:hypothetical protein
LDVYEKSRTRRAVEALLPDAISTATSGDLLDGQITAAIYRSRCPAPFGKYSDFQKCQITVYPLPSRPTRGAYRDRHGRWARDAVAAKGALTNALKADGEVVWF